MNHRIRSAKLCALHEGRRQNVNDRLKLPENQRFTTT
jgi:hypothetical protein